MDFNEADKKTQTFSIFYLSLLLYMVYKQIHYMWGFFSICYK